MRRIAATFATAAALALTALTMPINAAAACPDGWVEVTGPAECELAPTN